VARAQYTEKFNAWTASSPDAWQTQSLSGAPYNVPANAVVEVAIRNSDTVNSRYGGVRAVGSSLQRRIEMEPADGGGYDIYTMHVQTDSSSQIQHYADDTADIDFVLLGYWDCGTYVERFDNFAGTTSWSDEDLNVYGVSANGIAEILMYNEAPANAYLAGVRTNGSSLTRRRTLQPADAANGVEAITMLVKADSSASATIETYAGSTTQIEFYLVGYWSTAPGSYTELFADIGNPTLDATWQDVDLTAYGVSNSAVAEILLANEDTDEENEMGVRANGSSLARLFDLRDDEPDEGGDGDLGRMHVLSDSSAVIEFRMEDVSDAHYFYVMGYWDVGVILSNHTAGQESDDFHELGAETNAELFAFRLAPCSGSLTVTQIIFRLTSIVGLVNGDWAGIELVVDSNSDGNIGVSETTTVGGTGTVNTAAGTVTFSTSFVVSSATHYILRADFASLSPGDQVTISLAAGDISATDSVTGSTTSVTHKELIECYFEKLNTWSASSSSTWQTQTLSGSPYSVPANAVVEIAIRNADDFNEHWGGVRAVGSSLERRFLMQEAEDGGYGVTVMHVQTNSSSQIQHYASSTGNITFVLLGYWTCGAYVERFDTLTAGVNTTWTDKNLCSYGVGPGHVAEFVMANDDTINESEAGVRANGSSLQRRLNIIEAEGGGVSTATMFVEADTSTGSTVEVYAQDNTDIDFYLVGYWGEAPLAYTELFVDVGSPSSSATWQDRDLTANGVPDTAHAEFVLANAATANERNMGVRANGSSVSRVLNLKEAESGGTTLARMHVASDSTATIEHYHSDISTANDFLCVGYWVGCSSSTSYVVTDLGAITGANRSLAYHVNATEKIAGFEENASGNPDAWFLDCGTFTSLGTLGGSYAEAHGINASNRVVGWAQNGSGKRRAFTWVSPTMTDLGVVSGRTDSEALAVNASAEVVGTVLNFGLPPYNRLAFIYLPVGAYTLSAGMNSLGTLGGTQSVGMDINDSGQVVGGAQNGSGNFRPFRWQNGTMTNLGTLGGESASVDHRAESINSSGDVCGRSYTSGGAKRGFFWDGSMTDLGVLTGGTESWAFGVNESQVVVGTSNVTGGAFHAFVWDAINGMRDLNDLDAGGSGWTYTRATDINDDGTIVGFGTNGSGNVRAFMLTPNCTIGGGGSAAVTALLASGQGETDEVGTFDQLVIGMDGDPLAIISLIATEPAVLVDYSVSDATLVQLAPPLEPNARPAFADGVVLERTLKVDTEAIPDVSVLTVSLLFTSREIAEVGVDPSELELHFLDTTTDDAREIWIPAGKNIGESPPTAMIGDSGFTIFGDHTIEYWCVRDGGGTFRVGKPYADGGESEAPAPAPRACGVVMLSTILLCSTSLWLIRVRVRRHSAGSPLAHREKGRRSRPGTGQVCVFSELRP
jgi:probable HAF family extracellular repeat protein